MLMGRAGAADSFVQDSLELYARQMLALCALRLEVPRPFLPSTLTPSRIKKLLPPSAARRIRFVDRRSTKWSAIERYVRPVLEDVGELAPASENERDPASLTYELASHVYSIALSTLGRAQAVVPPVPMPELLDRLGQFPMSSEARARLAVLRGVAGCFERKTEIPVLVCRPGLAEALSESIDEVLDDAYLLEASRLRTFFSPAANWAALRRDLRKILRWIVRNRPWARNAIRVGEQAVAIPAELGIIADALAEVGAPAPANSSPVLLESAHQYCGESNSVIQLKYPGAVALF